MSELKTRIVHCVQIMHASELTIRGHLEEDRPISSGAEL